MIKRFTTENEFLQEFLPAKHTEHDIAYLKARFKWENSKTAEEVKTNWHQCVELHKKTSFKTQTT